VERKYDIDLIKHCTVMKVEGSKPRGRPRKTWWDVVKDVKRFVLSWEDVQSPGKW